jgi:hypothetical protein
MNEGLRLDDHEGLQDGRKPAVKLDQGPTIMVGQPDTTMQSAPQDNQLMSKRRVLSLKPQLRPERRGQDGQNETEQPDHPASLGDSVTSSTRTRFSVHTRASAGPCVRDAGFAKTPDLASRSSSRSHHLRHSISALQRWAREEGLVLALGHLRRFGCVAAMSDLPLTADEETCIRVGRCQTLRQIQCLADG